LSLSSRLHVLLACLLFSAAVPLSQAQTYHDCKAFFINLHDTLDCTEAVFSETPVHLTLSGMPSGNGFALGGVVEQNTHYVSPFALPRTIILTPGKTEPQQPDYTTKSLPALGSLWSSDGRLAGLFSTNGSWVTTGMLTLMPKGYTPSHRTDHNGVQVGCNKLGPLCTQKIFGVHFEVTHRSLETISFYGIGPGSPQTKYVFHQNDTYGSILAALPLTDWLSVESGFEYRQTDLPPTSAPNSVSANFTNTTAPGLTTQPGFAHTHIALRTAPLVYLSPYSDDQDENHTGPLMKPYFLFTLRNAAEYHWYAAQSDSSSSFDQLVLDSDENIQLATIVRHFVQVGDIKNPVSHLFYSTLARACGDNGIDWSNPKNYVIKVRQRCRFGNVDLRSHIVASHTDSAAAVPFYLQPTVGGSDIDSRPSLRAFPNYRFRAPDALFVQTDYSLPIRDPLGLLVFYDAGTVGPNFSSLSFANLRQDAGIGVNVSLRGNVVAQGYVAWGSGHDATFFFGGHGTTLGYNFAKLF
jgi:hypothetical protein